MDVLGWVSVVQDWICEMVLYEYDGGEKGDTNLLLCFFPSFAAYSRVLNVQLYERGFRGQAPRSCYVLVQRL